MEKFNLKKRRCKNGKNTMGKFNLRKRRCKMDERGDVKTMKTLWENSI